MNRNLRTIALAAAGAAAVTAVYALFVEPRWLQRTRTRMHFAQLPPPLEGLRIALLTDLHASSDTPPGLVAHAVQMTMREQPDLIAITGDIAETEPMLEQTLEELAKLRAPLGVYIVPGNHDYRDVGIERWHDAVSRRRTLIDLTNGARFLTVPAGAGSAAGRPAHGSGPGTHGSGPGTHGSEPGTRGPGPGTHGSGPGTHGSGPGTRGPGPGTGGSVGDEPADGIDDGVRLCIAGVDDLSEGTPHLKALHGSSKRDFTILLAHNPDQAERARRGVDRVDLILSGHTHGGQVRLPVYGAIVNSVARADLYEAGVRRRPWTQVYTSRGIGTAHLPVRFLTRPEVALLTLSSAPRERAATWRRWLPAKRRAPSMPQRTAARGGRMQGAGQQSVS